MVVLILHETFGLGMFGWTMALPYNFPKTVYIAFFRSRSRHCWCQYYCWIYSVVSSTEWSTLPQRNAGPCI